MEIKATLFIGNPRTGLSKVIDVSDYTAQELKKTFLVYSAAGYRVLAGAKEVQNATK